MIDTDFWARQRVLVTGHTGFKGAWLSLWLHSMGATVSGLALEPPSEPSLYAEARIDELIDSTIGTIDDPAVVETAVQRAQPTVILHLAAQSLVRASYDDPSGTFLTNVVGTAHVLDSARRAPDLAAVVSVTSDKCYENREWDWGYRENEPMGGHDPYSASKGCAELITASMRRSFFNDPDGARVGSGRAGNVIGGGDWADDRLIPDIVKAFGVGEEVVIRSPQSVRPWQHVLEPLGGYLLLAQRMATDLPEADEGWNFGPPEDDARPVEWIVRRMASLWGGEAGWRVEASGPHEAKNLKLDTSKARNGLGWEPRLDLETTIDWLIAWYREHLDGGDARELSLSQIADYEALGATTDTA